MNTLQKSILSAVTILAFSSYAVTYRAQNSLNAVVPTTTIADVAKKTVAAAAPTSTTIPKKAPVSTAAAPQTTARAPRGEENGENGSSESGEDGVAYAPAQQTQTQTPTPAQTPAPSPTPAPQTQPTGQYKNGTFTGSSVNVFYGNVQVQAVVQNGALANVTFLQYPNDRSTSRMINSQAMPQLVQEAIQAQSANVNGVSGATETSRGFIQSLGDALTQAHV
jgi:uncharacterized protein with FMN-binding domain